MAAGPLWSGQLRLSLVSMARDLHSATRAGARIGFRQIHEPSGKRIRYEKAVFDDPCYLVKVQEDLPDVATALIGKKSAPFDAGGHR